VGRGGIERKSDVITKVFRSRTKLRLENKKNFKLKCGQREEANDVVHVCLHADLEFWM